MKTNEATRNRPEGDRVLDAPYIIANIDERIDQIKDEETWDKSDHNAMTLIKTEGLTIVLICMHKEATINDNIVDGIVTIEVIEGSVNISTNADHYEICERGIITLRPNIPHSIYALKEAVLLLSNYVY
jgi:quercetin dioxygenase-like cupin family protein